MALLLLAGAGYAYYKKTQQQQQQEDPLEISNAEEEAAFFANKTAISLLPAELSLALLNSSLSTVTFLDGNYEQDAVRIETAVNQILESNPWLGGWLAKGPPKTSSSSSTENSETPINQTKNTPREWQLWYDPTGPKEESTGAAAFACLEEGIIPLTRETPYDQLHSLCQEHALHVPSIKQLQSNSSTKAPSHPEHQHIPLWSVRMVPDAVAPTNRYALIVSMAHFLGDAHTFYQLHGMLLRHAFADSSTTPQAGAVVPLNPIRQLSDFPRQAEARLGADAWQYLVKTNPTSLEKVFQKNSSDDTKNNKDDSDSLETLVFSIRQEWLTEQLQQVQEQQHTSHDDTIVVEEKTLLFWWFFHVIVQPTVALWAHPLRPYLDCLGHHDAGNYQNPIPYTPIDYATPQQLQASLRHGRRLASIGDAATTTNEQSASSSTTPLPSAFQLWRPSSTFAIATDWHEAAVTAGSTTTSTTSGNHLPLFDLHVFQSSMGAKMSGMIIFSVREGRLGAFCTVRKSMVAKIAQSGIMDEVLAIAK